MSVAELERTDAIQLDWNDVDGVVTVTPRDQDRFTIRKRRAIEMLRRSCQQEVFDGQLQLLINSLGKWIRNRQDIKDAYITLRDGALAFIVVRNNSEYNAEFEDGLSALDLAIANDGDLDLIELNVLALPAVSRDALDSFLNQQFLLSYVHGE